MSRLSATAGGPVATARAGGCTLQIAADLGRAWAARDTAREALARGAYAR